MTEEIIPTSEPARHERWVHLLEECKDLTVRCLENLNHLQHYQTPEGLSRIEEDNPLVRGEKQGDPLVRLTEIRDRLRWLKENIRW